MIKDCRAIVFDLFQTLIPVGPGMPLHEIVCRAGGLDKDSCGIDWRGLYILASSGKYPGVEPLIRDTLEGMNLPVDEEMLSDLVRRRTERHQYGFHHVDPETPRVIQSLRQSGLLTALLSNSDSEVVSPFGQSPLCDVFDDIVFSHEVGLAKPDPAIFQLSCDRLGLKPSECLFVGDGANREFDGARAVGMKTALVMRYANPERRDEWGRVCDFVIEDLSGLPSR